MTIIGNVCGANANEWAKVSSKNALVFLGTSDDGPAAADTDVLDGAASLDGSCTRLDADNTVVSVPWFHPRA